jgi:glycosyltransferase involved in cell wall biosynthesis
MKPTITLAVLAMNHEKYIEQACRSILGQTHKDFNIVFVDNNSTDRTFEIADEIFRNSGFNYKGVKNTMNRNVSQNFNILVNMADGEYISFLSGDDWYTADAVEKKLKFIHEGDYDLIFTDGFKYMHDTGETVVLYPEEQKKKVLNLDNYFWDAILDNFLYSVGMTARREALVKNPFEEKVWMEDWEICLRFSLLGYKLGFLDEKLFYYRILKTSLSNNAEVMHQDYFTIVEKYIDQVKQRPKVYKAYRLRQYRSNIKSIENKAEKDKTDLKEYAENKRAYALLKYSFPKREVLAAYWSIKKMLA